MLLIWARILVEAPWPTATTAITAAIPMMIPSAVNRERPLFRASALSAILMIMSPFI